MTTRSGDHAAGMKRWATAAPLAPRTPPGAARVAGVVLVEVAATPGALPPCP
jgi:hypothetical protein